MKFLFPYLVIALLTLSCGEDNTDNDDNTVPAPQEEVDPDNEIRWSRIELLTQDSFVDFYTHTLTMDLNRRPIVIDGSFRDDSEFGEGVNRSCTFSISLTESQSERIAREADDLDVCSEENDDGDVIIEGATNAITLTDQNGNVTEASKNKFLDLPITQTWLCEGKSSFYSYLKNTIEDDLPEECPPGALKRF